MQTETNMGLFSFTERFFFFISFHILLVGLNQLLVPLYYFLLT